MSNPVRPRTSAGLRDLLFDELEALTAGKADPQRSLAVSKLAHQVIGTVRAEMDYLRFIKDLELETPPDLGQMRLGSEP